MKQAEQNKLAEIDELDVRDYLLQNPDFLQRHPNVLQALELQDNSDGTSSLLQRQVSVLRHDNQQLQDALAAVHHIASINDSATVKVGALVNKLLATSGMEQLFQKLYVVLADDFAIPYATVRIFPDINSSNDEVSEEGRQLRKLFPEAQMLRNTQCGVLAKNQVDFLFGNNTGKLRSFALVPLGGDGWHGMLCMGCEDKARFTAGHDTQLLDHIGNVLTALLQPKILARNPTLKI